MAALTRLSRPTLGQRGLLSQSEPPAYLTWVILATVLASLLVARAVAESVDLTPSTSAGVFKILGYSPSTRLQPGHQPAPAAANAAASTTAPAPATAEHATASSVADPTAPVAAPPESQAAAAQPNPAPAASPNPGDRMRVANTDGQGVVLRSAPQANARQPRGLVEGSQVTVLARSGSDWVQVRADNGQEGWVPPQYLVAH